MKDTLAPERIPAGRNRLRWPDLPKTVRTQIEERLGSRVRAEQSEEYGFTPGLASRISLVDGRKLFLKAIGPQYGPHGPITYRREADIAAQLPASALVPRLWWSHEVDGWVALAFDEVHGQAPALPWRRPEFDRVMAGLDKLSTYMTPSPIARPELRDDWADDFYCWRRLAGSSDNGLDTRLLRNLDLLASLEARWSEGVHGVSLLHGDLRGDNVLLTESDVVFVDWPNACIGAPWVDLLWMLPSAIMQGGPDPEEVVGRHRLTRRVAPSAIDAMLAAIAGYLTHGSMQPAPPGMALVRAFQRAQGEAALEWLSRRLPSWR